MPFDLDLIAVLALLVLFGLQLAGVLPLAGVALGGLLVLLAVFAAKKFKK